MCAVPLPSPLFIPEVPKMKARRKKQRKKRRKKKKKEKRGDLLFLEGKVPFCVQCLEEGTPSTEVHFSVLVVDLQQN